MSALPPRCHLFDYLIIALKMCSFCSIVLDLLSYLRELRPGESTFRRVNVLIVMVTLLKSEIFFDPNKTRKNNYET